MSRPLRPALLASCLVLSGLFFTVSAGAAAGDEFGHVWLGVDDRLAAPVRSAVQDAGGRVLVAVPERGGMLARIPEALAGDLERGGVRVVPLDAPWMPRTPASLEAVPGGTDSGLLERLRASLTAPPAAPADPDALGRGQAPVPPEWWDLPRPGGMSPSSAPEDASARPYGAEWQNTSEYLAGSVSVNLLLVESDGGIDPDRESWSPELEDRIVAKSIDALADVVDMHPGARLSFTLHVLSGRTDDRLKTGYEPISRPLDRSGLEGVELWMNEVLDNLGYPEGPRLTRSRRLADDTRMSDGTDWAVNLFVVNSHDDPDGRFEDGEFAHCWIGGPHGVLTTDNSGWGVDRFDHVLRHELHHAFYALDQYAASSCGCGDMAGYIASTNDNCELCTDRVEPDVMINNVAEASASTRRLVGSQDGDRDGTADLMQIPPDVTFEMDPQTSPCDGFVSFRGVARVVAPINANPWLVTPRRDISLREIAEVEVRVDDSPWQPGMIYADDGELDEPVEAFSFTLQLPNGRHWVKVRAVDDLGQTSREVTLSVDAVERAAPVGDTLRLRRGTGTRLSWQPAEGATSYRIRSASRPWEVDRSEPTTEIATTSWTDVRPGIVFYRVSAVDGCGREVSP